ncbi:MAG TPA: hypothetical protein PLU10_03515, partial [Chitinophagaceae bacterium]|nr:hypothetical protein [Chitinophagaceae bacterium]
MSKRFVLLSLICWMMSLSMLAQQKIVVNVLKEANIEEVATGRSMRIAKLLNNIVQWDSIHQTMFLNR